MEITENNVVQQIQYKNEQAIPFIINEYGGLLTAIIKRHLNYHQQDYEECLEDVLLSIWDHIHSFDAEKNSFKHWIAAIAKYKAIDYLRKQIILQNRQFPVADINEALLNEKQLVEINDVDELLEQLSAIERKIFEL